MKSKPKILVARKIFPEGLSRLKELCDVEHNELDEIYTPEILQYKLQDKIGALVTGSELINAELLQQTKDLKIVSNMMVGFNNFDLNALTQAGVMATNTPDVLTETTADLAFGLIISTARRISESEHWLRAGKWNCWALDQWLGQDIHGATLGIIGMGRIGQAIARRAVGFNMKVIYHNRTQLHPHTERDLNATYVDFENVLSQSDTLVLVVPYTKDTHHLINANALKKMKATSNLINIGRGGLVDDIALAEALKNKTIAGAGLDVYENEPYLNPALLQVPNITLTPHIGSASKSTRYAMMHLAIDNLLAGISGNKPKNLLNP